MFKKIVWATDGSEGADRALRYARDLAAHEGAVLVAVHSVETFANPRVAGLPVHADESELKAKIERQVEELAAEGIHARSEIHAGREPHAAHLIADVAREADADLIVVGTRGTTSLAGLLVGSVTHRLLHIAPCPVMVVPAGGAGGERQQREAAQATA